LLFYGARRGPNSVLFCSFIIELCPSTETSEHKCSYGDWTLREHHLLLRWTTFGAIILATLGFACFSTDRKDPIE
jgi:hypothetical protein